jgi:hypothetical protein
LGIALAAQQIIFIRSIMKTYIAYRLTGADNDWRWGEQWLPHAAWYLLAASIGGNASP